jgi:hypothetical protein
MTKYLEGKARPTFKKRKHYNLGNLRNYKIPEAVLASPEASKPKRGQGFGDSARKLRRKQKKLDRASIQASGLLR